MNKVEQLSASITGYTEKNAKSPSRSSKAHNSSKNKVKKKHLNYNHREISARIVRASKSKSAALVLASARTKLSTLRRCEGTGMYNERELSNAILHARRMVQVASKKVKNLKEEEMEKKNMEREEGTDSVKRKVEVHREIARKEQQIRQEIQQKELMQVQKEKREWQELKLKEKTNRNKERGKITEANMDYLKGRIAIMREQGYSTDSSEILSLKASLDELSREQMAIEAGQVDGVTVSIDGASAAAATTIEGSLGATADATPVDIGSVVDISL